MVPLHWHQPHGNVAHIRCFPHVINICVQEVIKSFESDQIIDLVPDDNHETWKEAARKKPLARLRALIRALRASGKRREAFDESIFKSNSKNHFFDPDAREQNNQLKTVEVPQLNLLRDVDTRWDSVYQMVKRAHLLRPVSSPLSSFPPHLTTNIPRPYMLF